jgi:tRNA pseudouridine38-40 synthase
MPRYALKIEYHGAKFAGWQRQKDQPSVQACLDIAVAAIDASSSGVIGAGRTDAGVHATGQVAHCDLARQWDYFRLSEALNYHLKPHAIAITAVAQVSDDFHARFSAVARKYLFRMISRRPPITVERGLVWQVRAGLDHDAMKQAAAHLIGKHDFTTFRSVKCQAKSPIKTVDRIDIQAIPRSAGIEYQFHVEARSFLHNQVRSFVGTLERVGSRNWQPDDVRTALEARDRTACGTVSPPQGLYLSEVVYVVDPFET